MIERLILAAMALLVIVAAGSLVRRWSRERNRHIAATHSVGLSVSGIPQIVSFYGPNCGACDTQKLIINELRAVDPRLASVRYVDAVADTALALQYGVIVVPTTIVASATGKIVGMTSGVVSSDLLAEQLSEAA